MNTTGPRRRLAALALLTVLGLAGCGRSGPPPPLTLDPLDVSQYTGAPCSLLTPDRAARRHLTSPGTPVSGTEPGCRWSSDAPNFPSITASATTTQGLSDLNRSDYSFFQPTKIDRYSAVQTATNPGGPRAGHCTVRVGVASHSNVDVSADYPAVTAGNAFSADPCADADTLATEIVGSLLAGSP
jgi:hypothetical protein